MDVVEYELYMQRRSDGQEKILQSIELLSEVPENEEASFEESTNFADAVSIFTVYDYDDLVNERVIQGRCAYTLCSSKPRPLLMKASMFWQLDYGAGNFCSKNCKEKSVHVQSQLLDLPVWEREPHETVKVFLREYPQENGVIESAKASISQTAAANSELAFERGESVLSRKPEKVMTADIVEKNIADRAVHPPDMKQISHTAVEGYEPRIAAESDDEEDENTRATGNSSAAMTAKLATSTQPDVEDEEGQWRDMFASLRAQNG